MGQFGKMIGNTAAMGLRYADRLLKDIPEDRFARMSAPGGQPIIANHPAFILGHLCLYPEKVASLLSSDTPAALPPAEFEGLFSKTATCTDDVDGSLYPAPKLICSVFETTYAAAIECISQADDGLLLTDNPVDSPMKHVLPTLGSMLNFYLGSHVMIHLGQLSTWRRMEGLPPC